MLGYKNWKDQRRWRLDGCLGKGSFASVHNGVQQQTGEIVAVKVLDKATEDNTPEVMRGEVDVMQAVSSRIPGHVHLVQLLDVYEDDGGVYLLMSRCQGWQLAELLERCGFFTEEYAAWATRQVASALQALHTAGIIHRDIKPENVMFSGTSPASPLKLIDFGLAITTQDLASAPPELLGSPDYVAPEVIKYCQYTPKCDIWALGVMLYNMLSGALPFPDETHIKLAPLRFAGTSQVWSLVSQDAKDLVRLMLTKDPARRPTAAEVLSHKWLRTTQEPSLQQKLHFKELASSSSRGRSKSTSGILSSLTGSKSSSSGGSSSGGGASAVCVEEALLHIAGPRRTKSALC